MFASSIGLCITLLLCISQADAFRFVVYSDCRAPKVDMLKKYPYNLFNKAVLTYINSQIMDLKRV